MRASFVLLVAVLAGSQAFAEMARPPPSLQPIQQPAAPAPVFQHCAGPARGIMPNETFNLTCSVVSSLGGANIFVVPEMWTPGNGCIITADKPRVVMVGNNFGVSATMINRCASGYNGTEGGLGWFIHQVQP